MDKLDWTLPFGCLPPGSENEWDNLSHFVTTYNSTYNKSFVPKEFPENRNRNSPEPEVLLCDGTSNMVIERKVFPFPSNHVREHQLWHEMNNEILERLPDTFSDDLYEFEIKDVDMPTSRKEMLLLVDAVMNGISEYEEEIKTSGGIYSDGLDGDVCWSFCRVPDIDREDISIDCGLGFKLKKSLFCYDSQRIDDSIELVRSQLYKVVSRTVPKFKNYSNCTRVLILEPHTNILNFLPSIFRPAMQTVEIPTDIDQVWLAVLIELSELESVLDYRLIHSGD